MDNVGGGGRLSQHGGMTNSTERLCPPTHLELADHAVVLVRSDDELQVGVDPRNALVLGGPGYAALLERLRSPVTPEGLLSAGRTAGLSTSDVGTAVQRLREAGLLTSRPRARQPGPGRRVRLIGAGPVGRETAEYLIRAGVSELMVFDPRAPEPATPRSTSFPVDRATELIAPLGRTGTRVMSLDHWSKPETLPVDLTLVVADGPEVDRLITDHLVRTDQPHLLVRSLGQAVWVGPLVLPGRTPCVRCTDLTRTDVDPSWPAVLAQLGRVELGLPSLLSGWAAAVAAAQALAFLGGGRPETTGATLEMSGADLRTELRTWPSHPACGCRWRIDTEWGA